MKKKRIVLCLAQAAIMLLTTVAAAAAPPQAAVVRWPAVAGINYPAEPETLLATVRKYFDSAETPEVPAHLLAVIASPAPYGLAGKVSAHAFKSLQPGQYERVIIIAPGHGPSFENCSIPAVDVFLTPLGPVAVDAAAIRYILYSPIFHAHQIRYDGEKPNDRIHEYEFSIETLLPFLQERLHEFKLVPILIGDLRDPEGQVREGTIATIADTIRPIVNERTLLVVSSSFTHYGGDYGNAPFTEDIESNIARLDRLAFEQVLARNLRGFRAYLKETKNVIDGKDCIQILLKLLPPQAQARILAYETSAAITNDTARSVSYAAFTFHDPSRAAATPRPDKARPLVLRRPEQIAAPPEKVLPPEMERMSGENTERAAPDKE
ncbi:MAG TPA: AmmeMemoRadiSam system protein B [Candidatus Hydrogenedentes bacterium]|nr:AmmeMemoRadiSam system protein B [Candidatus Hydrogenedentota bacterium]